MRVKLSKISELNDPFELRPYDLTDPRIRQAFLTTRDEIGAERGLACFSSAWSNPVIWAHYSDNHKGLCLGFEVPDPKGNVEQDEFCQLDSLLSKLAGIAAAG